MKGMPHYRQYPMGDVVNANLEPGEYVVRRNAVNALGTENMELLNQADGAHGNLNKLIVSADLENKLVQDNAPEKSDVNGYPIANSPVRQRVDATRNMQEGGEVEDDPVMFPAGKNIFGQPTEDMSQSQMSDMLLDMMTGGVGGTVKGVGKVLKGTQMKLFPSKALKRMSKTGKKSTKKKSAKEYLETAKERENRLWSDTDLAYKSGDNRLAEKFLEEHGYRPYLGQGSKEFTYKYTDKGLKAFTPYEGVKSGIEQKTFKNPTFKALRDWMGYQEGGMVHGYQEGGEVEDEFVPKELAPGVSTTAGGGISFAGGDVGHKAMDAWKKDPAMFGGEHDFRPKSAIGKLQSYLSEKRMGKLTESDPQLKSWWNKPSGDEGTVRVQQQIDDVQAALGDKSTEDYSRSLGKQTHLTEGSPYYGTSLVDLQEDDAIKGKSREAQYFETDKGRYRLSAERQGGLFDPVRNFFGAIPKRVDSGEDFSYQEGGQVPTGNWGPPGAYNEALQKDRKENIGSNNLKSLSILEQLRLINAGTGVEPERLEQLNPERQIKERGSIFNRPDSNEYNMPTFQGDPGASRTPVVRAPSDNYGGNEIEKNLDVLIPYLQSYGRMKTPIQEKTEFLYNRLGVNPEQPPSSLQGLQGAALLQRLGSEGI
tara:strand:+ start:3267 stop:5216 length:1950 start_codon:yes stop_codon:yes gene_type:complete